MGKRQAYLEREAVEEYGLMWGLLEVQDRLRPMEVLDNLTVEVVEVAAGWQSIIRMQ